MNPGRELDALVAEKVTGRSIVPHYSTDIAAAWEVVEHIQKMLDKSLVLFTPGSQNVCDGCFTVESYRAYFQAKEWHGGEMANGISASHAICLAALKLVGVEL